MLGAWSDARRLVLRPTRAEDEKEEESQSANDCDSPHEPLIKPVARYGSSKSQGATPETTPRHFQRTIDLEHKQPPNHDQNESPKAVVDQSSNKSIFIQGSSPVTQYGSLNERVPSLRSILHHSNDSVCMTPSAHSNLRRASSHSSVHFLDDDVPCMPSSNHSSNTTFIQDCSTLREQIVAHPLLGCLLICVPIGVFSSLYQKVLSDSHELLDSDTLASVVFLSNFLSIIPLAWMLGNVTEELSLRVGPTMGGFLNAAFGNIVEMIVAVAALRKGMIALVQQSLLGSILSNMLLVMGMSFLLGGLKYSNQYFNKGGANVFASMLLLACLALAVPSAYVGAFQLEANQIDILDISRVTAVIIFSVYLMYMVFQMKTHTSMFESEPSPSTSPSADDMEAGESVEDEIEEPTMTLFGAITVLAIVTLLIAVCSDVLIDSIQPVTIAYSINENFVGIILLPIVGNAAEHATAVTVAMRNKVDLSIGVAIGSSTQIALFVIPLCVLLGWMIDQPMTLNFGPFATVALVMSALIVTFIVKDGQSNWLLGAMLIGSYIILATSFYFHPKTGAGGAIVRTGSDVPVVND